MPDLWEGTVKKPELWWWKYRASKLRREWKDLMAQWVANHIPKRVVYFATIRLWARVTVAVDGMPSTEHWSRTNVPSLEIGEALTRWEYYSGDFQSGSEEATEVRA